MDATALSFHLGVNYPWIRYGHDFGRSPAGSLGVSTPATGAMVREDFRRIRTSGADLLRWFLFADGRGGFVAAGGIPTGPDDMLFADVARALALAEENGLRICFSLFDYHWLARRPEKAGVPNHAVLQSAAGREAFLETVLVPLFREFRAHPALFAWEIANEPEWAIREFGGDRATMRFADFRAYAEEIAAVVHEFRAAPVTLGSARLAWLPAWSEIGLDLLEAHYYPKLEAGQEGGLAGELGRLRIGVKADLPLWMGELPACAPDFPGYSLEQALDDCRNAGLAGALVWRWRASEPHDTDRACGTADPAMLQAWLSRTRAASV